MALRGGGAPASGSNPYVGPPVKPQDMYSSRPLRGKRLNDTAALVANGIPPPQGTYELHSRPSAEASVTPVEQGGARGMLLDPRRGSPAPDNGQTMRRTIDYMDCPKGH